MKITNKTKLPQSIVDVVTSFMNYSNEGSDLSVTQLIDSPQQIQLLKRHRENLTEDVTDMFWSFLGTVAHNALERHGEQFDKAEERLFADVNGVRLSGKPDVYHDKIVIDYKLTSVWSVIKESRSDKWIKQLNAYAWLFRKNGYEVEGLKILAMMRDWSKNKAKFEKDYPDTPIKLLDVKLLPDEEIESWVLERVEAHRVAADLPDHLLPYCTMEDMWARPGAFAVHKPGETKAIRLFPSYEQALAYKKERAGLLMVTERPAQRIRCEEYCLVKDLCIQNKTLEASSSKASVQIPF